MDESRLILEALEETALAMSDPETLTPTEGLAYAEFETILKRHAVFGEDALEILLKSVLVTAGIRTVERDAGVQFAHRVFHEYFLAAGLVRRGAEPPSGTPEEVAGLYQELATGMGGSPEGPDMVAPGGAYS